MEQYHYTWGDEEVLGSSIRIIKESNNIYNIYFKQEAFEDKLFRQIKIKYGKIINESFNDTINNENSIISREITIKIKAPCNPRPELLFEIIH